MSTNIATIEGVKDSDNRHFIKMNTQMNLTRFLSDKGIMLQLSVCNSDGYIQLTKDQVKELSEILNNSFDEEIYPSE